MIKLNRQTIKLLNVHGPVDYDGTRDNPRRQRMKEIILDQIRDQKQVILGGDFNVQPQTQTIGAIEKKLVNIFSDELATSFNLQRKDLERFPGFQDAVVDMMFVSPEIQVIDKFCPQIDISDHLPLVATLAV